MKLLDPVRFSLGGLILVLATGANGANGDLLAVKAGITRTQDDNLFKRPSDGSLGGISSERLTTTQIGITAQKAVSLQSFELSATLVDTSYEQFKTLDSRNNNYSAAWHWQLTPHFTGKVSSSRQQTQTDFADFRGAGQNQRTSEAQRVDANLNFYGGLTLGVGKSKMSQSNSQNFVQDPSNEQVSTDISLKYAFPSGKSLAFLSTTSNGGYKGGTALVGNSSFSERRNDLHFSWPIADKTTLSANLGRVSRKIESSSARDFNGSNGGVSVSWRPTGKTSILFGQTRATEAWQDVSSSSVVRDSTSLSGTWQMSSKLALRASVSRQKQDFGAGSTSPNGRIDNIGSELVTIEWSALRNVMVSATAQKSRRISNVPGFDYNAKIATVSASVSF